MQIMSFIIIIIIIIKWKVKNDWDMFWVVRFTSLNGINVKSKIERERVKKYSWWESKKVRGRDGK